MYRHELGECFFENYFQTSFHRWCWLACWPHKAQGSWTLLNFLKERCQAQWPPKWGLSPLLALVPSCSWHFFKSARGPVVRGWGYAGLAAPQSFWLRHLLLQVPALGVPQRQKGASLAGSDLRFCCVFARKTETSLWASWPRRLLCRSNDSQHASIRGSEFRVASEL